MTFGDAIEAMYEGKKVARSGWNGRGQWVVWMPPMVIAENQVNARTKKHVPYGDLRVGGYMVLMTVDGVWQPGWNASTRDVHSDDWKVVG